MPRVKRGTIHTKKRRNLLKKAKGFKWGRKKLVRQATTAVKKAGAYAYRDRRNKKRVFRRLWLVRINAALRETHELSYSKFIGAMKAKNIDLDRKVLSELALTNRSVFDKVVESIKK